MNLIFTITQNKCMNRYLQSLIFMLVCYKNLHLNLYSQSLKQVLKRLLVNMNILVNIIILIKSKQLNKKLIF